MVIQELAVMGHSAEVEVSHLNSNLLGRIYLHHLSPTDLLTINCSFTTKDDVNINPNFHGAGIGGRRNVFRPIFPFQGDFCPGELGQLPPTLELASDHGE